LKSPGSPASVSSMAVSARCESSAQISSTTAAGGSLAGSPRWCVFVRSSLISLTRTSLRRPGLPRSRSERRLKPAHNRSRGFPTRDPLSGGTHHWICWRRALLSPLSANGLVRPGAAAVRSGQSPR
jgi:hypothetical protein